MRASKESAEDARQEHALVADFCERLNGPNEGLSARSWKRMQAALTFVGEFLNVAKRRLPTEASYERNRKRRKGRKAKS